MEAGVLKKRWSVAFAVRGDPGGGVCRLTFSSHREGGGLPGPLGRELAPERGHQKAQAEEADPHHEDPAGDVVEGHKSGTGLRSREEEEERPKTVSCGILRVLVLRKRFGNNSFVAKRSCRAVVLYACCHFHKVEKKNGEQREAAVTQQERVSESPTPLSN
ncbi:hypothetical protein EYF80_006323 [Liparis tanakae]|uniref:Uncharacterized protein n=1 Tax=Liparis tanakae TaxID=230148 RepID=A0A4Z2J1F3_9TELE|nr:hypothetical protein EYF80_006323 [Liparis tanakae]